MNWASVLHPLAESSFFDSFWAKAPVLIEHDEADRFLPLLSIDAIDRILARTAIRYPAYRLVEEQAIASPVERTLDGAQSRQLTAMILNRTASAYAEGATLLLQGLERRWPPIAGLAESLGEAADFAIQANAYLTPPGAQGFPPHYDTHDVLLLQVEGRKRWRVWEPRINDPMKNQKHIHSMEEVKQWCAARDPVVSVVLEPGSVLYIPRGFPHEGVSEDGDSLHITLGFFPARILETARAVLLDAIESLREEEQLRNSILTALGERDGQTLAMLKARITAQVTDQTIFDAIGRDRARASR